MPLLTSRRLAPLLVTQTLGAINDNLFKNALVVLIMFHAAHQGAGALVALAGGLFILPFGLLSATAGQLADRFEKRRLIMLVKAAEIGVMGAAAAGFLLDSTPVLMAVLFGLGVQATFFGPLKYAILPQHLAGAELVAGNGLVEAGTFGGILAGTIAGPLLFGLPHGPALVAGAGLVVALAGVASAALILPAPASAPGLAIGWNVAVQTGRLLASARANPPVWLCILGLSWFWVMGATLLTELPVLVRDSMGAGNPVFTLFLAVFSVGVGVGSVACGGLLRGEVSARLVPFAALGLSVFLWDFAHVAGHVRAAGGAVALLQGVAGWRMLADLLLLAACGGVYSVPLYAVIQERSERVLLSRMIAANNVVNAGAMVGAAAATALLAVAGVAPGRVLLVAAVANLAVAAWIVRLLPEATVGAAFRLYFRIFHAPLVRGLENLPPAGTRCVFVVNHQSFLDGALLAAFLPGAPTFAVNVHIARRWWARPFLAAVKHFPIDPVNPFNARTMVHAVREGANLVIFPEGRITVTGALMKVYDGAGMIADRAGAAMVPVRIDGAQFSRLSRMGRVLPRRWFARLSLTVLPPVAIDVEAALLGRARRRAVGAQLQAVMEQAGFAAADTGRSLFSALLDARDRFGASVPIIEDTARVPMTYKRLVLGALVLGRRLLREAPQGGRVGVMLPNANGAVVTFLALQAWGRVPAMLNFSAGAEGMLSACAAAQLGVVLSSRAFVERARLG